MLGELIQAKLKPKEVSGKTLLFNKKKNTFTTRKNMRLIILLNSTYKLFTKIIANRILQTTLRNKNRTKNSNVS